MAAGTITKSRLATLAVAALLLIGITGQSFGQLASVQPEQVDSSSGATTNPSTTSQRPKSLSLQLLLDQKSKDSKIRKAASKKKVSDTISLDLASGDPDRAAEAIQILRKDSVHNSAWLRDHLENKWLESLLALKQYDIVQNIIDQAFPDSHSYSDTAGVAGVQYSRAQLLLSTGKGEDALVAAKGYYNICQLPDTAKAIDVIAQVLANTRAKDDPQIVRKFKMQQEMGAQMSAPASQPSQLGDLGENILNSIHINSSQYTPSIETISQEPISFTNLTAKGNLLLLADRTDEAQETFKSALDLASSSKDLVAATENVARSIRANTGIVGPANAYILAARQAAGGTAVVGGGANDK